MRCIDFYSIRVWFQSHLCSICIRRTCLKTVWWHSNVCLTPSSYFCCSSGKLLDVDDHYYPALSTSRSEPSMSKENTSSMPERKQSIGRRQSMERRRSVERKQSMDRRRSMDRRQFGDRRQSVEQRLTAPSRQIRERAATEPERPKSAKENRCVIYVLFIVSLAISTCPIKCPCIFVKLCMTALITCFCFFNNNNCRPPARFQLQHEPTPFKAPER